MENKLRYFIYCRKSTEDEDKQILSIDAQLRELREYAQKCNLNVVGTFTESKSAHKPGREVFGEVIRRLEAGEADALLVWQINRIARNAKDGGSFIQLMDDGIVRQVDTPFKQFCKNGDDLFFMNLEFGMAKKYSDDLSDNVKRGIRQKYERGEYYNLAPLGYTNFQRNGHKNIEPDPVKAPLVTRVFEEYATGKYSLGQLCQTLVSWGLSTNKGKKISKSHLQNILTTPTYYGYFRGSGELHKGTYEPLISKETFDAVQIALHDRSKPKKKYQDWAYAGLIKCGCGCHSSIIFEAKRKYYKGTDRWADYVYARSSKRCGSCDQEGITLSELEKMIGEKIDRVAIDEDVWKLGIELLNAKYEKEAQERAVIVANRQREWQKLQDELDGYFKMRAKEEITADEFQVKKVDLLKKQSEVRQKIDEGQHNQRHWLELAEDFLNTAFQARDLITSENLEDKRMAVKKIGWNLMLKDRQLVWAYQEPFDVLLKPEYRSDLCSLIDYVGTYYKQVVREMVTPPQRVNPALAFVKFT